MGAKRVTQNNARVSRKNGRVFFAKHLDGPDGKAARMNGLLMVWRYGVGTWKKGQPMEEDEARMCEGVEAAYYKKHFSASLDAQNEKHRKSRHKERIRSLEDYIRHPDTCPESTLFYGRYRQCKRGLESVRRVLEMAEGRISASGIT